MRRNRTFTEGSDASDHYKSVNERPVDDISLGIFLVYQSYIFDIFLDCHSTFSFNKIILVEVVLFLKIKSLLELIYCSIQQCLNLFSVQSFSTNPTQSALCSYVCLV